MTTTQSEQSTDESTRTIAYELAGVTKTYPGKREVKALNNVSLQIPSGQFVAIQGPTGGGKSTLLQMLGALDRPTEGSVTLSGHDLTTLSDKDLAKVRAQDIGFVFQSFNLIPTLTALENVETAFTGAHESPDKAAIRQRSQEALDSVGLADRGDHLPGELSGGQQQRVAIARALVKKPSVLLADEPTGALDEATRDEIMTLVEDRWKQDNLTVVIVTHDSEVAARAERRLRLRAGTVREQQD